MPTLIDLDRLDYEGCDVAIATITARKKELYPAYAAEERRKAAERRAAREASKQKQEAQALEDFATLIPGDIVKVTGVRDTRYPLRQVMEIEPVKNMWSPGQFRGRQMRQLKDGSFEYGREFTTHMANKIRGVVHRAEMELTNA